MACGGAGHRSGVWCGAAVRCLCDRMTLRRAVYEAREPVPMVISDLALNKHMSPGTRTGSSLSSIRFSASCSGL